MEITRIRALRGPNVWSRQTAIEAVVRCRDDERAVSPQGDTERRLRELFPGITALRGVGDEAGIPMARLLERAALSLQAQAGCPVSFSRTTATPEAGLYQVVVEYTEEPVGRRAIDLAHALVEAAARGDGFVLQDAVDELRTLDEDLRLGPSTGSIVAAAAARGIPYRRLTDGSLVQFGWGSKARRIWAAEVDATSAVSEQVAQDKDLTKRLLAAAGVPVPEGRPVADPDEGWRVALALGLPVVVKPRDGNQGKGVTVNIVDRAHFDSAFAAAAEVGEVMVEQFLPGHDFRLLVVGHKLVAAARRDPPHVVGDGRLTVRQLVDRVNEDPRRGDGHATSLTRVRLDEIALARLRVQGLGPDDVPAAGQRVVLRNNANLSTGGTATDVTDDVHPEVAARAVAAARMIGLHVCGVDVVCERVDRPLESQRGGIVEVNAAPGLRMHLAPSYGKPRRVGEAIAEHLFGHGEDGRIPVVAVTGTNGKTTVTRLIAHLFAAAGLRVGMTNTDGAYVDGRAIDRGDCSGPKSARNVLAHPDTEAAVLETARGGILREGLGFDRCRVAVVTNIGAGDHLGLGFLHTPEDIAWAKSVIVQNVDPDGYAVLNAADPLVLAMAAQCPGDVILFAADGRLPALAAHRAQGRRVVFVDQGDIVAAEGSARMRLPLREVPLTQAGKGGGTIGFQVENVLAAVGAAWGAGLPFEAVHGGLASFSGDAQNAPARFNVMEHRGATVIADYGHNPDAMRALVGAVDAMPARRRSVVISAAGDRRDEDIRAQTAILGAAFDDVILYQDAAQRGRADGEVIALLREGLAGATRARHVEEIRGEFAAIDRALARLEPGDLCLVLVDQVDEAMAHLASRIAAG
ncbi:MAG: cyanophycin synthetase [Rubrivivax sp.]|jgi:cyanophycin synthetase|nr:cyanophycin synthetase [Rubrivivax sp.]